MAATMRAACLLAVSCLMVLLADATAMAGISTFTWVPATVQSCANTCKAYGARKAKLTAVYAGDKDRVPICAVKGANWVPGYENPSSGCHYYNTASKAPAIQLTGYHCACVTANGANNIIQWVSNNKKKQCKPGFEHFAPNGNSICRTFTATKGRSSAVFVGFQTPATPGATPKCLSAGGGATSFDYLCVKSGSVICSGTPLLLDNTNSWPSTCARAAPGQVCNTSCKEGFSYVSGGSGAALNANVASQCLPDGHWSDIPGMCKEKQGVVCSGTPTALGNANNWPSTCSGAAVGNLCNTTCEEGFGYYPDPSGTTTNGSAVTSQCQLNGQWSNVPGVCKETPTAVCSGMPAALDNANNWPSTCSRAAVGNVCNTSCKEDYDYYLDASGTAPGANIISNCLLDGSWTAATGVCKQRQTGTGACANVTCSASGPCHGVGTCDPATGLCSNPILPNGTPCDDGTTCTTADTCQAGICTGTATKSCSETVQIPGVGTGQVTVTTTETSTTVVGEQGVILRANLGAGKLTVEYKTPSSEVWQGNLPLNTSVDASGYAANRLAVMLVDQLSKAAKSGAGRSFGGRRLLNDPGCDWFPDIFETCCNLKCCALHDECYKQSSCTVDSWVTTVFTSGIDNSTSGDSSQECVDCNLDAVDCILSISTPTACADRGGVEECFGTCPNNQQLGTYFNCPKGLFDTCNCACGIPQCPDSEQCCTPDEVCVGAYCCPKLRACGSTDFKYTECCAMGYQCKEHKCCPNQQVCQDKCCLPDDVCLGGQCCPLSQQCGLPPLITCCNQKESCIGGQCCPEDRVCGSTCCSSGQTCNDGKCCKGCNGICCPQGQVCGIDFSLPDHPQACLQECGSFGDFPSSIPNYCQQGFYCADPDLPVHAWGFKPMPFRDTGACIPDGSTLCLTDDRTRWTYCRSGLLCQQGKTVLANAYDDVWVRMPVCCEERSSYCGDNDQGVCCFESRKCDPAIGKCCSMFYDVCEPGSGRCYDPEKPYVDGIRVPERQC